MEWESIIALVGVFGVPVLIVFFVCLFRFLKNRMRHREVLAAIEKGIVLPEPAPSKPRVPRWITNVAIGAAMIVFSPAFLLHGMKNMNSAAILRDAFPSLLCLSIGVFCLIRGLLLRKYENQN